MPEIDNTHGFKVRKMRRDEFPQAIEWAAKEGWNPGLFDEAPFWITDPDGYFAVEHDEILVACISAIKYNEEFGFTGFLIVRPDYRGSAAGVMVSMASLKYLEGINTGLDGVFDRQDNYARLGFKYAYSNLRYEFTPNSDAFEVNENLTNLKRVDFYKILEYDTLHFPTRRETFLQEWLNMPNLRGYAMIDNGYIMGYGAIRTCGIGNKIGPLFANDATTAETIFRALCTHAANTPVFLDVPDKNHQAVSLAKKYNMKKVFGTARMYSHFEPDIRINEVFGVTSFELG